MCKVVAYFCITSFIHTLKMILVTNKMNKAAILTLLDGLLTDELHIGNSRHT
jgi:hypothetical protein